MNKQKLYIKIIDRFNQPFYEGQIAKFDASRFNTIIYTQDGVISESTIIRLTENIRFITIVDWTIVIVYESNARAIIYRQ